jgi:hypothetical protein
VLGRRRLLSLPFALAEALAASPERLPNPPLTREKVRLLRTDKVAGGLPTPATLEITARRLDAGLPASLHAGRAWAGLQARGGDTEATDLYAFTRRRVR